MKSLVHNTYVNKSIVHGWGGFAAKTIRKGGIIEECPYVESVEEDRHPGQILAYLFDGQKRNTTMLILGYGAVYNHSQNSNTEYLFDKEKNVIVFIAKRTINKGEEIFVDYGKHYWSVRKHKPK